MDPRFTSVEHNSERRWQKGHRSSYCGRQTRPGPRPYTASLLGVPGNKTSLAYRCRCRYLSLVRMECAKQKNKKNGTFCCLVLHWVCRQLVTALRHQQTDIQETSRCNTPHCLYVHRPPLDLISVPVFSGTKRHKFVAGEQVVDVSAS